MQQQSEIATLVLNDCAKGGQVPQAISCEVKEIRYLEEE
jgi:hypothetical protein